MANSLLTRSVLAKACFGLGSIWAAAGALKFVFGIRVTFPLFPPLDLERVSVVPSLAIGLVLVFVGAWLERVMTTSVAQKAPTLPTDDRTPLLAAHPADIHASVPRQEKSPIHRTPSA